MPQRVIRKFPVGMRIMKTGLAVYICCLLARLVDTSPFFAAIAAVICMKMTYEDSLTIGRNRVIGTIVGGLAGMGLLYTFDYLHIRPGGVGYDLLTVAVLIFLIKILADIYQTGTIIITLVVFLSLLYMDIGEMTILAYSTLRVVETLAGVLVALAINRFFPYREEIILRTDASTHQDH